MRRLKNVKHLKQPLPASHFLLLPLAAENTFHAKEQIPIAIGTRRETDGELLLDEFAAESFFVGI